MVYQDKKTVFELCFCNSTFTSNVCRYLSQQKYSAIITTLKSNEVTAMKRSCWRSDWEKQARPIESILYFIIKEKYFMNLGLPKNGVRDTAPWRLKEIHSVYLELQHRKLHLWTAIAWLAINSRCHPNSFKVHSVFVAVMPGRHWQFLWQ